MTDGQIQVDNLRDLMAKRLNKESDSAAEEIDKIKKCVEEGKQRLNWIGKNVLNI